MEVVAYSALALTVGLSVTRPRLGRTYQVGPATGAFIGVVVMMAAGVVQPEHILSSLKLHWRPFLTIVSIMIAAATAERLGVLDRIAEKIFANPKATPTQLFTKVFILSAVTSSVLNNDAMVILLTPLVLGLVQKRYPQQDHLLLPFAPLPYSRRWGLLPL